MTSGGRASTLAVPNFPPECRGGKSGHAVLCQTSATDIKRAGPGAGRLAPPLSVQHLLGFPPEGRRSPTGMPWSGGGGGGAGSLRSCEAAARRVRYPPPPAGIRLSGSRGIPQAVKKTVEGQDIPPQPLLTFTLMCPQGAPKRRCPGAPPCQLG